MDSVEESTQIATVPTNDKITKCAFFVARKRRNCKLQPVKGMKFCTEHVHLGDEKDLYESSCHRQRVPCPLDPKHSCFEDQLQHHLLRCNAREKHLGPYQVRDINIGDSEGAALAEGFRLAEVPVDDIIAAVMKIKAIWQGSVLSIEDELLEHQLLKADLQNPDLGKTLKHLRQQASLLGHLDREGMLKMSDGRADACSGDGGHACYVEFGAGRAKLASDVMRVLGGAAKLGTDDCSNAHFLLVERWRTRNKRENQHRDVEGLTFERVRMDIKDLALGLHPAVQKSSSVIAFGKHVCGSATDLSLRCLMTTLEKGCDDVDVKPPAEKQQKLSSVVAAHAKPRLKGAIIALCCHHRCSWREYVGKAFWKTKGLSPRQFQIASSVSGWATCGFERTTAKSNDSEACDGSDSDHEDGNYHDPRDRSGLSLWTLEEKEDIGRTCKRVIDLGRMLYLEEQGFASRLAFYVTPETSLENVVLIAKPLPEERTTAERAGSSDDLQPI